MVNSTVNGKKIGDGAGKDDKITLTYYAMGKEPDQKKKMGVMENKKQPSISLIESLRKNGQIIEETSEFVTIKAYQGTNPNKEKHSEDLTH